MARREGDSCSELDATTATRKVAVVFFWSLLVDAVAADVSEEWWWPEAPPNQQKQGVLVLVELPTAAAMRGRPA